jgi:hypothetical protein
VVAAHSKHHGSHSPVQQSLGVQQLFAGRVAQKLLYTKRLLHRTVTSMVLGVCCYHRRQVTGALIIPKPV